MIFQKLLLRKIQNFFKRIYKRRSVFLAALLFILSAISPVVAKVSSPTSIVQSQQDAGQLANKAVKLYQSGKFAQAATAWEQTAAVFATQGDRLNQAMALSNLSLTYQQLGQWDKATKAIEDSLGLLKIPLKGNEQLKILAQSLDIQGNLQRELGQTADALNTWQQATKIYSQTNDQEKLSQSKINQAQAMQDLGLYPRACNTLLELFNKELEGKNCQELGQLTQDELKKKLRFITDKSPSLHTVMGLRSLGELLRSTGQLEQSQLILETSLNLAQKLNSPEGQADAYLSLGNTTTNLAEVERVRRKREDYEQKALDFYSQVIKLSPSTTMRQQAQLNQLSLLLKLQRLSEAEELWRTLNSQLSHLSSSHTGVYLQINFAQSLVKLAQKENFKLKAHTQLPTFNEIDRILAKAAEQARSLGDTRAEAHALGNRGGLYELKGSMQNLSQAEELTKQALGIASNFSTPDIAYQFFWQLGRIRREQGDTQDAIAAYTKAYNALQSLRSELVAINPEVQFSFRDSVEPVYRQLVELDLKDADSLKKAGKNEESQQRLIQARSVIESLQLAELNNFFREACVEANPKQIDEIDQTAAVIYTIVLPDRLQVLLSLPNQPPSLHTTPISQEELEETVTNVRRSLIAPVSEVKDFLPIYKQMYDWLIQPLESELANSKVKTLAFVLDGDLRNIPMAILHDGKQYLLEKYAIALTPGLQLVNPKPIAEVGLKALTAGLSKIRDDFPAHEGFRPLSNVELELEQIEKFGVSSRELLNDKFTSTEIKKEILASRVPPIVHLATHGQFSSRVEDTFILSWDSRINVKQLSDLLRDNTQYQGRPIELLVLSACETASGDNRAALGLAGIAVRAGARSTLATLWAVEDKSTAQIMGEFYHQLEQAKKTKVNKAEALRQAQLALTTNQQYKHPHYWAPFVLVGNWQ
ncbi:CHAT domain-containing protein [Mastigocladopsis repens]|uniref:CHAT domain-containing protein n=1 Tax=Mastigocladopsis repens TaxID=221287 RepID=UPI00030E23E4|nr:CHAT domain-containing protein [Mastigocladopsis repens]